MGFFLRAGQMLLGAAWVGVSVPSCYSAGTGTDPPPNKFYFPVGLAVSPDATVLYAVNSDFDLQYNGGTLQSYDLSSLRADAAGLVHANVSASPVPPQTALPSSGPLPFVNPSLWKPNCMNFQPPGGMPLGEACAPPVDSTRYVGHTAIIGAFATELQTSIATISGGRWRLFIPVRGDATLTWADVDPSNPSQIDCGQGADKQRCDAIHHTGSDPNQDYQNTRHATMPGEPFGMAQTEDGTAIAVTHQTDTKTSLLTTGLPWMSTDPVPPPTMQFVLDGVPTGGVGIAAVPHDPDGPVKRCEDVNDAPPCVRAAFLETSRNAAEIDLLRYYDDDVPDLGDAGAGVGPSLHRPFLQKEAAYAITSNAVGTDSRGIVMDPTPRIACKALPGADPVACAQLPARVFFASRTPPALGIGEIGGFAGARTYDPDRLVLTGNVPLPIGPSKVYLAPIVDANGNFAPRIFVVCFDSSRIIVYDPEAGAVENIVSVGPGPFAMAFDPFTIQDVGEHKPAPPPPMDSMPRPYRFAYVASFTQSFVQMIDLDNSQPTGETFERVVFTIGQPTVPKGQ